MLYHRESESRGAALHPEDAISAPFPPAIGRYWRKGARWTGAALHYDTGYLSHSSPARTPIFLERKHARLHLHRQRVH